MSPLIFNGFIWKLKRWRARTVPLQVTLTMPLLHIDFIGKSASLLLLVESETSRC